MDTVQKLESAFASLGSEYSFRKKLAEKAVQKWHWATFTMFDPRPLYFERAGFGPGRRLKQAPSNRYGRAYYGTDEKGRITVERDFNEFGFYETFYNWASDLVEVTHFDYASDKKPINFTIVCLNENRALSSNTAAIGSYSEEEYQWDGELVSQVILRQARREQGSLEEIQHWYTAKATYDHQGVLQKLELHWPPDPPKRAEPSIEVMFERRGKRIYRRHR
jgi:hypothetical protein